MLLRISKWCIKTSLFAPLILAPFLTGDTFSFPTNGFFPFISLKAIFFRVAIEASLFFLILHVLFSNSRRAQLSTIWSRLKKPLPLSVIAFSLATILTGLTGRNPTQSIWSNFERGEGAFQIAHYSLFFLLLYVLFTSREEIVRLMKLSVTVSVLVCAYAFTQLLHLQPLLGTIGESTRISGTLGNPSYLAAYLLIHFIFLIYLYLHSPHQKTRWILTGIFAFEFIAFLNTGTRAAYIALAVGVVVVYLINIFVTQNAKVRSSMIIILVGLSALGIAGIGAYRTFPALQKITLLNRLFDVPGALEGFGPRIWSWKSAVAGISERPILGWGAENFPYTFDKYYNPNHYGIQSFFDRTHNIFLEYLISGGFVLLLAYLAIWFFYYRSLRGREKNLWYSLLIAGPIVYLVQGFFLFDVLPTYLVMFLFIALTTNLDQPVSNSSLDENEYELGHAELLAATGLLALTTFIIIATAIVPWKKNLLIARAHSASPNNPQQAFNAFQDAILYKSLIGQEEAISGLSKFSIDFLEAVVKQNVAVPIEIIRGIVDTNNTWFDMHKNQMSGLRNWYLNGGLNLRAGLSFNLPDYVARGTQLYEEALAFAPKRIEFIQLLLEVARAQKDEEKFAQLFARAQELRPDISWTSFIGSMQVLTPTPASN